MCVKVAAYSVEMKNKDAMRRVVATLIMDIMYHCEIKQVVGAHNTL